MSASIGHNTTAGDKLKSIVERIENLKAQQKFLGDDIKEILDGAEGEGFDKKAINAVIKVRKQTKEEREQFEATVETYMHALGMLADTPLGMRSIEAEIARRKEAKQKKTDKKKKKNTAVVADANTNSSDNQAPAEA